MEALADTIGRSFPGFESFRVSFGKLNATDQFGLLLGSSCLANCPPGNPGDNLVELSFKALAEPR
jgi:hypothetical protein